MLFYFWNFFYPTDESLLQQIETASSHSSDVASLDELLKPGGGGGNVMKYAGKNNY